MTALATDDGFCRTHDDARAVLRHAAQGARVFFGRLPDTERAQSKGGKYAVVIDRYGTTPIVVNAVYTLPVIASALRKHVTEAIEKAR